MSEMFFVYAQTCIGLAALVIGGDFLVRGSVAIAQRFNVSELIVGLTVVAFGTSAPELVVGIDAALTGVTGLALGNVIGSNIANVLLVIGVPALIRPIISYSQTVGRETYIMLIATAVFMTFTFFAPITAWMGAVLFAMLIATLGFFARMAKIEGMTAAESLIDFDALEVNPMTPGRAIIFIILGIVGLAFGSNAAVTGGVQIAAHFSVDEALIGLTLIAIGTSLPELVTSVAATIHRHGDVAIGNVIGSNIFNLLAVIGVTAMITPVTVPPGVLQFDIWVMLATSLAVVPLLLIGHRFGRSIGFIFLGAYGLYIFGLISGMSALTKIGG